MGSETTTLPTEPQPLPQLLPNFDSGFAHHLFNFILYLAKFDIWEISLKTDIF